MFENNCLKFNCSICGTEPHKITLDRPEFTYVAHENCVEWSDCCDSDIPDLEEKHWIRSDKTPEVGEERILLVRFPFNYYIGDEFNTLFYDGDSNANGWETESDVENTGFVICQFLEVIAENNIKAWIKVKVNHVIMLKDFVSVIEPVKCSKYFKIVKSDYDFIEEYGRYTMFSWSAQGDLGDWGLIYKDFENTEHMLLYSKWDFHNEHVYCGNLVV